MRLSLIIILLALPTWNICAQAVNADFSLPPTACLTENLDLTNLSTGNVASYEWDLCAGELESVPQASVLNNSYGGYGTEVKMIEHDGNYYGFFIGRAIGKLFRLDFGTDLYSSPQLADLGGFGINSPNWRNLEIVKEGESFVGFIIDNSANILYRFLLGDAPTNAPSVLEAVYSGAPLNSPFDLFAINSFGDRFLFVANMNSEDLTRISFSSFLDTIGSEDVDNISFPGSGGLSGLSMIKGPTGWFAGITAVSTDKVYKVEFGNDLSTLNPTIVTLTGYGVGAPSGIALVEDNNIFYFFIQSQHPSPRNSIYRMNFGGSLANAPTVTEINGIGMETTAGMWGFSMFKSKSDWLVLSTEVNGSNIYRVQFEGNCLLNLSWSIDSDPKLQALSAGSVSINLKVADGEGSASTVAKQMTISTDIAPAVSFTTVNVCLESDIEFLIETSLTDISSVVWDFGDSTQSSETAPLHRYNQKGNYTIKLEVLGANGCSNRTENLLNIYPSPISSFDVPAGIICTGTPLSFNCTTSDDYDGKLSTDWYVNGEKVSEQRNLTYVLEEVREYSIDLATSIPGCSDNEIALVDNVSLGPVADFQFSGNCEDALISFNSLSTGDVESVEWYFDGLGESGDLSPSFQFTTASDYAVTLIATSSNGCANSKTKTVVIDPKPVVDFSVGLPPNACTDNETLFTDLTSVEGPSKLASHLWQFNDPYSESTTSVDQHPAHIYSIAADYTVSLTATTDKGCSEAIEKSIVIHPSPVATLSIPATCQATPASFLASGESISSYYWELGTAYYDVADPVHTFNAPGSYHVKLVVTSDNNCVTTYNQTVDVPEPLATDFEVAKNCVGFETVFTDATSGDDPVQSYSWNFNSEGVDDKPITAFVFNSSGNKTISLQVLTKSGCVYEKVSTIEVVPAPEAGFSTSTEAGAVPLKVEFTNTSKNANDFRWHFTSSDQSTLTSPAFIFESLGEQVVQLTAINAQGCDSKATKVVTVEEPHPDVELKFLSVSENLNGTLKVIVTLENKGNTVLRDLPVVVDLSGAAQITEVVSQPIKPLMMYNLVLDYGINQTNAIKYLCAEIRLENDRDLNGNRICKELDNASIIVLAPYPNPAKDFVSVEWVCPVNLSVNIELIDSFGRPIIKSEVHASEGLNNKVLATDKLLSGLYYLIISTEETRNISRIFVFDQN